MIFEMLLILVSFLLIPHVFSLNFSFTTFQNDDRILYEKSARSGGTSIHLVTQDNDGVGRATYYQPMHLWDKTTGKLTDFTTNFTFVIDSKGKFPFADGMAFFLAPTNSKLPNIPIVEGGTMGLIIGGKEMIFNSIDNPFVAIEFDIFPNDQSYDGWDPSYIHVGVDINSIKSVINVTWDADIVGGRTNEAFIRYNATTHNLSISFTNFDYCNFDYCNDSINMFWEHIHYIVDLRKYLPERVTFGFAAATGEHFAIHRIDTWSFSSEDLPNGTSRSATTLVVGLGVGGGFVLACGVVCFVLWKKKRKMEDDEFNETISDDDFERGTWPKRYSYIDLESASNHFKEEHKLGQGGFGGVYRGFLKDSNSYVAIKRISTGSKQGEKEFSSEVRIIGQLRHRNLVQLIGWCHEKKERLLVYEYMPNGSLDSHLFNDKKCLTWSMRFKIAQGLASALFYLHEEWKQCVVHRDIKSSNIMLDSNFNAKLGDFGLARLVDHAKGAQTTALAGTLGYIAPECIINGRASKESDIYSFGVVALEIACGRKAINFKAPENEISIVNWVWQLYESGKLLEAVDSKLEEDLDLDQIKCLLIVGMWCAHPNPNHRPSIKQVIHVLNFEAPFPSLPSSYPTPTYQELPVWSSFSYQSITNTLER